LDGDQLFNLDFTPFLQVFFFTVFSVYKTYAAIPPINTPQPAPFPHTIISHSLLLTLSPYKSPSFDPNNFLPFWGKKKPILG